MEVCKGCRDAGDEESQGQPNHSYPPDSGEDEPTTVQARVPCIVQVRISSSHCWRMLKVHMCAPCLITWSSLLPIMLSFILRHDMLFCNIVPNEGVHLPRNYHVTALKSLREALRSGRLAGK